MQTVVLQPAFVLHCRNYRETSQLIDLLTPQYGRLRVIARGSKRSAKRQSQILRQFTPLSCSWRGKTELMTLIQVEPIAMGYRLTGKALFSALYLNELLMRVLPLHDAHLELYAAYEKTLQQLQRDSISIALRLFEKQLLHALGYALPLQREGYGEQPIQLEQCYHYCPQRGFKPVFSNPAENKANKALFRGATLLALHQGQLSEIHATELKPLMRMALAPLLNNQPLYSRQLFF